MINNKMKKLKRLEIKLINSPTFNVFISVGLPVGLITLISQVI